MYKVLLITGLTAGLTFGLMGCSGTTTTPAASGAASGVTPATVCQAVATVQSNAAAAAQLASIDPHSALGIVWAQFQSGCVNGIPAAGVSASWTAVLSGMFKTLLPTVLPALAQYVLPLLIGLI